MSVIRATLINNRNLPGKSMSMDRFNRAVSPATAPTGVIFNSACREPSRGVCFTCHTQKKDEIAKVTVKHGGLATKQGLFGLS